MNYSYLPLWISRINTDGTNKQLINDDDLVNIQIQDDWIYYIKGGTGHLHKVNFEEKNDMKMNKDVSLDIYLQDNWLYYINQSDGSKMYKIRNDGMGRQSISELPVNYMVVKSDWI